MQTAWLLLFCVSTRANFFLRTMAPKCTSEFACRHDEHILKKPQQSAPDRQVTHTNPHHAFDVERFGLGQRTERTRHAALWRNWANNSEMIRARHPEVASSVVKGLFTRSSRCLRSVAETIPKLGCACWRFETMMRRTNDREPNEPHPTTVGRKWLRE